MTPFKYEGPKTQHAAQKALDVQDACNSLGILNTYRDLMNELRTSGEIMDTEAINCHPVSVMFLSKLTSLTGDFSWTDRQRQAEDACRYLAAGQTVLMDHSGRVVSEH